MATLLNYYANDIWIKQGDKFVQDEMFLTGPPWRFALLYTALVGSLLAVRNTMSFR